MPQTSPMNWTILSTFMITVIMNSKSLLNYEKTNYSSPKTIKFNFNMMSWNW